jgi:hypothetical protein
MIATRMPDPANVIVCDVVAAATGVWNPSGFGSDPPVLHELHGQHSKPVVTKV